METTSAADEAGDLARAELAYLIDLQMSPLGLAAMIALSPTRGQTVLDVGCGAGETILQLADRVGPDGRIVGVDIAPRVLAVAQTRTAHLQQVTLVQEDAIKVALPDQSLDCIFSRFGMMFFSNPTAAFANMQRMLKPEGKIGFVCWRSMQDNEIDRFPLEAARLSVAVDNTPFSFENPDTIERVLRATGFDHIRIKANDARISSGGVDAMVKVLTRVGPLGKILREAPVLLHEAEIKVRAALSTRERGGKVSLGAATWIVTAAVAGMKPGNGRSIVDDLKAA